MTDTHANKPNQWLEGIGSRYFEVLQSGDKSLIVLREGVSLTLEQATALNKLGEAKLVVGAEVDYDGRSAYEIPQGTVPIRMLTEAYISNWQDEILATEREVGSLCGLPAEAVLDYLVHLNFVPEGEESIKILPTCIEAMDQIRGIGTTAIQG